MPSALSQSAPAELDTATARACAPAARPAMAVGLQLLRDASQQQAMARFDEAATLDPQCASASVYYVLSSGHNRPRRREHFRRARDLRAVLTPRERAVLHVLEPSVEDPVDLHEQERRAKELLDSSPEDPDLRYLHGRLLLRLARYEEAVTEVEGIEQAGGTQNALNEQTGAIAEVRRRHPERAFQHFDACLRESPDSSDCLYWKSILEGSMGKCQAAEQTLRRLTTAVPKNADAYWALGQVLLTIAPDGAAARDAFAERWRNLSAAVVSGEPIDVAPIADQLRLSVAAGNLDASLVLARKWNALVATSLVGRFRLEPLVYLIELLGDAGHTREARTLALRGLNEQRAWGGDDHVRVDPFIVLARLAYTTGAIDAPRFRELRTEWFGRGTHSKMDAWVDGYAGLPLVGDDIPPPIEPGEYALDWYSTETYARIAEQLTSAGRHRDAIMHAEAAVASCFSYYPLLEPLRAKLVLALAYDKAGERERACGAYRTFAKRLEKTTISLRRDFALKRFVELGCSTLTPQGGLQ